MIDQDDVAKAVRLALLKAKVRELRMALDHTEFLMDEFNRNLDLLEMEDDDVQNTKM